MEREEKINLEEMESAYKEMQRLWLRLENIGASMQVEYSNKEEIKLALAEINKTWEAIKKCFCLVIALDKKRELENARMQIIRIYLYFIGMLDKLLEKSESEKDIKEIISKTQVLWISLKELWEKFSKAIKRRMEEERSLEKALDGANLYYGLDLEKAKSIVSAQSVSTVLKNGFCSCSCIHGAHVKKGQCCRQSVECSREAKTQLQFKPSQKGEEVFHIHNNGNSS